VLCDDGLATGATMIVAIRWARAHGASRVIAGVPVAASRQAEGAVNLGYASLQDELDVPTFLRKQMD